MQVEVGGQRQGEKGLGGNGMSSAMPPQARKPAGRSHSPGAHSQARGGSAPEMR